MRNPFRFALEKIDQGADYINADNLRHAIAVGALVCATASVLVPILHQASEATENFVGTLITSGVTPESVVCPQDGGTVMSPSICD